MADFRKLWHDRLGRPFRLTYSHYKSDVARPAKVLLLHGIAADNTFWEPLVSELQQKGCEIYAPDLLGHGTSPKPDFIGYSTDDQARAVIALLRQKRLKNLIVVGHSMGGLVATRVATLEPKRVKKLLLFEPPLFADLPEFRTHARRRKFYYDIFERIALNPAKTVTMARIVASISRNWTKYLQSEQTWLPIERSLRNTIMEGSGLDELRDITIQTDIVHGRLDVVIPQADLKEMLRHNKNIKFYKTTERHRISKNSARYLANLIASVQKTGDNSTDKNSAHRARRAT